MSLPRSLALILLVSAAALAGAAAGDTGPVAAIEAFIRPGDLDEIVTDGERTTEGRRLLAQSCADLERVEPNSGAPATGRHRLIYAIPAALDADAARGFAAKDHCNKIKLGIATAPSKKSYLSSFKLSSPTIFDELPPCFSPKVAESEPSIDVVGKSWRSTDPGVKATEVSESSMTVEPEGETLVISLTGRADYNADGLEDLAFETSWSMGRMNGLSHLILSKTASDKVFRVVSDSGEMCTASLPAPPKTPCGAAVVKQVRTEFQKRYDAKKFASAYSLLDGLLLACGGSMPSREWIYSDLAITAHKLGRQGRCLELTSEAQGWEMFDDEKARKPIAANEEICRKALRCPNDVVSTARKDFKKQFDAGAVKPAIDKLEAFRVSCDESIESAAHGWLLSDLAYASAKAQEPGRCSGYLDTADRLYYGSSQDEALPEERLMKALAANRKLCPNTEPIPVSTPVVASTLPSVAAAKLTGKWISYCDGDPLLAKIVDSKDAPGAKAPYCVRFEPAAFDPSGFGLENGDPPSAVMKHALLLVETDLAEPVTLKATVKSAVGDCMDCECKKTIKKRTDGAFDGTATPKNGRVVFPVTEKIDLSGDVVEVEVKLTLTQGKKAGTETLSLGHWPRCM